MALPLLNYFPNSQNQRVQGFEVPGDEHPRIYTADSVLSALDTDDLISAAYRQVFHEQQMLKSNRQILLESQLRSGQITVRDFIRGLATSGAFRTWNFEVNNNYRFVELCVQRLLGRNVYDEREKIAWSIILATKGLYGFVDDLLNSEEYLSNFGENTVPYQRRRVLPQRVKGELPFERMPRYDQEHLSTLSALGYDFSADRVVDDGTLWLPPEPVRKVGAALTYALASLLGLTAIAVVLSWFGWLHL
ncbi:phycobilisome rod-core linker polypeptide [Pseudanabaena sp. FACHB-2040]|uniref:phycobilisome rod-core linker polypeptide n=1 Tax=Pseudanabaena sp. FACHB-2040 TaxID=2692859 RepID=UPI00168792E8|nr:phycobilisome rod-core linker polypeptide [Pseudanabaena sp. FACHB-2040]